MKLTVLVDNNTYIDQYYLGEPAVCYYIEDGETRLLLDTGYSDVYIRNAKALGIDLAQVSVIALSHGHNDHTRGLQFWSGEINTAVRIVAHPDAFKERRCGELSIGSPLSESCLRENFELTLSRRPMKISDHITFLGEIPSSNTFEPRKSFGTLKDGTNDLEDFVADDTALVYNSGEGLFIITGCSHSGICNIIEYAKQVCNEDRIIGVIGGFHLFEVSDQLQQTIAYFQTNQVKELYPCHCVSFAAKAEIHKHIPIHEVGVGLVVGIPYWNGIQEAIPGDLPEILHLQKLAFSEVALLMDNFDLPPLQQTLEDLCKEYENNVILKYISTDGTLVGSVRGYVDSNDVCRVGKLIVHPGYQNQGIGKALMYEIEKYFPACRKFVLFTGEETPNTLHLYEKVGYHIVSKEKMGGLSMILMEKVIIR